MQVDELKVPGAWSFTPRQFPDPRGVFLEWFKADALEQVLGHRLQVAQANHSVSARGTLRGVHFADVPPSQAKYVYCTRGAVLDVVVDLRCSSESYGRHLAVGLDAEEGHHLYIPPGFAHGFCTLEPGTVVACKVSAPFIPQLDRRLAWDDPDLALPWLFGPVQAVPSDKDRRAPKLRDLPACFD